jgi:putative transposase
MISWASRWHPGGSIELESSWTESVAVGKRKFVEEVKGHLGIQAIGRKIQERGDARFTLQERPAAYNAVFGTEKGCLSLQNSYFGDINLAIVES